MPSAVPAPSKTTANRYGVGSYGSASPGAGPAPSARTSHHPAWHATAARVTAATAASPEAPSPAHDKSPRLTDATTQNATSTVANVAARRSRNRG
jgi:hypothetical protein